MAYNARSNMQLPPTTKCTRCEIVKPTNAAHFSKKNLTTLSEHMKKPRGRTGFDPTKTLVIPCIGCTAQSVTELECFDCHYVMGLDKFSKAQRKDPDHALCWACAENVANTGGRVHSDDEDADDDDDDEYDYDYDDDEGSSDSMPEFSDGDDDATIADSSFFDAAPSESLNSTQGIPGAGGVSVFQLLRSKRRSNSINTSTTATTATTPAPIPPHLRLAMSSVTPSTRTSSASEISTMASTIPTRDSYPASSVMPSLPPKRDLKWGKPYNPDANRIKSSANADMVREEKKKMISAQVIDSDSEDSD